jgi:8-oxo-dGTP diphosphatase
MAGKKSEDKMGYVKAAVKLYIYNDNNQVLLGFRKNHLGDGTWAPPGGHLEIGERFEDAAIRETMEETGLHVDSKNVKIAGMTNDFFKESGKHYVVIHMICHKFDGEVMLMEPDACEKWQWFDSGNLPSPLFQPIAKFLSGKGYAVIGG